MINDSWGIYSDCIDNISNFQLQIFDRWGNLIFRSDQPDGFGDGRKGGLAVNPGVYIYSISFSVLDPLGPRDVEEKGSLTLLR